LGAHHDAAVSADGGRAGLRRGVELLTGRGAAVGALLVFGVGRPEDEVEGLCHHLKGGQVEPAQEPQMLGFVGLGHLPGQVLPENVAIAALE
jgi:hypothetical protein